MMARIMKLGHPNSGHSLVEAIVAFALLATVLVPAGSIVVQLATQRLAYQKMEALAIGQMAMEKAIKNASYDNRTHLSADGKWMVQEDYQQVKDLIIIQISVTRNGSSKPLMSFSTARLMPLVVP